MGHPRPRAADGPDLGHARARPAVRRRDLAKDARGPSDQGTRPGKPEAAPTTGVVPGETAGELAGELAGVLGEVAPMLEALEIEPAPSPGRVAASGRVAAASPAAEAPGGPAVPATPAAPEVGAAPRPPRDRASRLRPDRAPARRRVPAACMSTSGPPHRRRACPGPIRFPGLPGRRSSQWTSTGE